MPRAQRAIVRTPLVLLLGRITTAGTPLLARIENRSSHEIEPLPSRIRTRQPAHRLVICLPKKSKRTGVLAAIVSDYQNFFQHRRANVAHPNSRKTSRTGIASRDIRCLRIERSHSFEKHSGPNSQSARHRTRKRLLNAIGEKAILLLPGAAPEGPAGRPEPSCT